VDDGARSGRHQVRTTHGLARQRLYITCAEVADGIGRASGLLCWR
jgi:hypothetical protein